MLSLGSVAFAVLALAVVLYNATLVDRRAPTISRVSLSASASGDPGLAQTVTAIDIEFSEPVRQGSVERRFRIEPYVAGTLSWDGSTAIFSPSQKLPQDTAFQVFVDPGFEDFAGNSSATGLNGWAFRTVGPPQVLAVEPADAAEGVPVNASITIGFDRLMDTSAVEAAIQIEPAAPFRAAWSGQTVTLTPDAPLDFGTDYRVRVRTAASDTDGNRLRAAFETGFRTVAAGLGIRATVPVDGVAGVGIRTPIAVVFDGPVEPASVEGALQITPPVQGTLELVGETSDRGPRPTPTDPEVDPTVIVFRPSQPLAPHTTYTVTLEPVVAPLGAPGEVAAGRTWTFTTGQPAVSGQNQVAFFSDRAGVRNVWLMNPDGSNARQLTTELVPVAAFDVTADGSRVAWSAGGIVRLMSIDGTAVRPITADDRFEYAPRFSPDGRSLLVARRDAAGTDLGYWLVPLEASAGDERQILPTGAPPLGSADLEGDGIEATEGYPPWSSRAAWDPDGRFVTITDGGGAVHLVDLAADPATPSLATGLVSGAAAAWDPLANQFVVAAGLRAPGDGLWSIATDGSISQMGVAAGSVAVVADGSVALLVRSSGGVTHVARAPRAGVGPDALTRGDDLGDRWPTFSPDGRSILFGRVAPGAPTGSQGIWVVDVDTGVLTRLTIDGAYPRWLP